MVWWLLQNTYRHTHTRPAPTDSHIWWMGVWEKTLLIILRKMPQLDSPMILSGPPLKPRRSPTAMPGVEETRFGIDVKWLLSEHSRKAHGVATTVDKQMAPPILARVFVSLTFREIKEQRVWSLAFHYVLLLVISNWNLLFSPFH